MFSTRTPEFAFFPLHFYRRLVEQKITQATDRKARGTPAGPHNSAATPFRVEGDDGPIGVLYFNAYRQPPINDLPATGSGSGYRTASTSDLTGARYNSQAGFMEFIRLCSQCPFGQGADTDRWDAAETRRIAAHAA
jgi:hypothetical protein